MTEQTFDQRLARRLAQEHAELDDPVVKAQLQLDRWWSSQRDFEAELADTYYVGGFQEHFSTTPSFNKGRREPDWRVR